MTSANPEASTAKAERQNIIFGYYVTSTPSKNDVIKTSLFTQTFTTLGRVQGSASKYMFDKYEVTFLAVYSFLQNVEIQFLA